MIETYTILSHLGKNTPMQSVLRKLILFMVVAATGCAPLQPPVPMTSTRSEKDMNPVFLDAERAYDNGQYSKALNDYNTFLHEAYDDPFADDALYKVGKIFQLAGRDDDALAVFLRLIHEFPQSALISDAKLETLTILFDRDDFESVIDIGLRYIDAADSERLRTPFYTIMANAYEAIDANPNAAWFRYQAWLNATDEESSITWDNFQFSVEKLSAVEIQALITHVTDPRALGALLYRLGMALIMEEKYDEALDVLIAFIDQFPTHAGYRDASDMILSLKERSRFIPFTIGCVLPLSGPYGLFGKRALEGIEFALSQTIETVESVPFQILVKDSRSDAEGSASAVDELHQQKVGAILGPMSGSDTAAATAQKRGIPIVVFTQKEGVTDSGSYVFRNFITPQMQVQALVSFAVNEFSVNRFAVLYPNERYGRRYMNLFWDQVVAHGRVVNGVEAYDPGGTDFATAIKKLAGIYYDVPADLATASLPDPVEFSPFSVSDDPVADQRPLLDIDPLQALTGIPIDREAIDALGRRRVDRDDQWHPIVDFDAIFIPDAPKKVGLVIPQLAYYDIRDVYLLGTNLWNSQTLLDMSGDYMKSALIVDGFFAQSQDEKIKSFVDGFKHIYNRNPGIIEAIAYDSAMMIFRTMRQTATDSRREMKKALLKIDDFDGVTGRTRFASNGEAQKNMTMLRIQGGRFVEAEPQSPPTATDKSYPD